MIIERKYVPFCALFNRDKKAWAIFESAFNKSCPDCDCSGTYDFDVDALIED